MVCMSSVRARLTAIVLVRVAEDRERRLKDVQVGVQPPAEPFEHHNAHDQIRKVALDAHVVLAHQLQYTLQHFANLHARQLCPYKRRRVKIVRMPGSGHAGHARETCAAALGR
jgi:hypothetical protein